MVPANWEKMPATTIPGLFSDVIGLPIENR
jgi:hypothetical protein